MLIRELDPVQCAEILTRSELGHLAVARHDQPYIVPIHFSFDADDKCLYAFSGVGQKIQWMRENPKVCVEIEDIGDKNNWTTVLVYGEYEELTTTDDAEARARALNLFRERPEWWYPAAGRTDRRDHHALLIYRIRIHRMSGRQAARARV
jgi:uncharacterized protein